MQIPNRTGKRSFALIATLALLVVATLLLALFVSTTLLDRSASYSYSQSLKADQIGVGALHLIEGQLQAEMYKDGLPDTGASGTYTPVFTNVTSANILPQANVTNSSLPSLIKMSTNGAYFFSGGTNSTSSSYQTGLLQASTISTTWPSLNSRSVSTNVWNQIYLGQYSTTNAVPNWVLMTRAGPASTGSFTGSGAANNPLPSNNNYVVGRFAYAIYDEGSLLDINAAGYPGSMSTTQIMPFKGTLAGADLTQIPGITSPSTFIQWRNAASGASASTFLSYVTNYASTNGFEQAYPGDSTFISRQDLIRAALNDNEGFNTSALTNLATFTRELNAPSWAPAYNAVGTKYQYAANALKLTTSPFSTSAGKQNPNPLIPLVRYTGITGTGTITGYRSDGTTYTYAVNPGDPVVQHRFPLDRLAWITPKGPSALLATSDPLYNPGGTVAAIQACFGLSWGASENKNSDVNWSGINVWKYVGSVGAGTTELIANGTASAIKTLSDVGNETTAREPNFFELLQSGVLSGSIALTTSYPGLTTSGQGYPTLQLLRIGASMISQVQSQAYPINIEYNENDGGNISVVASGVANLPYINMMKWISGLSPDDTNPGNGVHQMAVYGIFGLWNPHQQPSTQVTRPPVELVIQGSVSAGSGWSYGQSGYATLQITGGGNTVYGTTTTLAANTYTLTLSNGAGVGANGFLNPYPITSADVVVKPGSGSSTVAGWTSTTSTFVSSTDPESTFLSSNTYEAFRVPDFTINFGISPANAPPQGDTSKDGNQNIIFLGNVNNPAITGLSPFQAILKYQDSSGKWVPYDYWVGYNYAGGSWPSQEYMRTCYYGGGTVPGPPITTATIPNSLEQVLHAVNGHSPIFMTTDPRTMRFGTFSFSDDNNTGLHEGILPNAAIESVWSGSITTTGAATLNPNTPSPFNVCGYGGGDNASIPGEFGGTIFLPADLCRNNLAYTYGGTTPGGYFSAYNDPDGIRRIADSGLFTTSLPFTTPPITGNPYFDMYDVPTTTGAYAERTADRPIVLNRRFASVGELGYTFRDDPWRSLDFFSVTTTGSSTSADSGLLDLFTVVDSPNNVVAGRVSLNTKNTAVMQAILNGTTADVIGNTMTGSGTITNPTAITSTLTSYTQNTGPLVNKDQLVTKFNPTLPIGPAASPFETSDMNEQDVKPFREAYIRSLADVTQTRTWNLLIDLVAQSGKYPPTVTAATPNALAQFEVDGERHYWLHVAIDRFTGKIIDRQLELIGP